MNAIDEVVNFGQVSGLTLNLDKTEAIWIGSMPNSKIKIHGIKWSHVIKYLGVYLDHDKIECIELNWKNKLHVF